ncbi:MAG: hypothetical protein GWM92_03000, partial [Gemmatimonadetes bacterium]|nr:hypothetical protein [Gemmatimonadota bacterium]NIR77465.1 hypothetical protein [Gemmatimonadota bacterium]NIT85989.1 hypothetical protein [Gemmatimonadota bacterium]NIU29809.1 hypothetical protein [Gemmatimonadota bacterium]NIU34831.1 hypothetical protein [Gemmatimonadota bacterium]
MTLHALLTLAVLAGVLVLLVKDLAAPGLVVFGGVVLLLVLGVVTPREALEGFSNPAPFT